MTKYNFIRIVNNKDPTDYYIDCTSLEKWRTRVSGLKTQMYRHMDTSIGRWRKSQCQLPRQSWGQCPTAITGEFGQ